MQIQLYQTGEDAVWLAEFDGTPPDVGDIVIISAYPTLHPSAQYRVISRTLEIRLSAPSQPWHPTEVKWACECALEEVQ